MENLFKFALIRPAVESSPEAPPIPLAQANSFQEALAKAHTAANPRAKMKRVAAERRAASEFVARPQDLALGAALESWKASLDGFEKTAELTRATVVTEIKNVFGAAPAEVVKTDAFKKDTRRLKDAMLVIKLLPEEHSLPLEALAGSLQDLEIIQHVVDDAQFPKSAGALRTFRRRSLKLPDFMELGSILRSKPIPHDPNEEDDRNKQIKAHLQRFASLTAAIRELGETSGERLEQPPAKALPASSLPDKLRAPGLLKDALAKQVTLPLPAAGLDRSAILTQLRALAPTASTGAAPGVKGPEAPPEVLYAMLAPAIDYRTTLAGRAAYEPLKPNAFGFRFSEVGAGQLSKGTQTVLKERGLNAVELSLDHLVDTLSNEVRQVSVELDQLAGRGAQRTLKNIGGAWVMVTTPLASPWNAVTIGANVDSIPFPPILPQDQPIPNSHGSVAPSGVADLILIKQQLKGYEAVDVAHIENVLQGEGKLREHVRRQTQEEFLFREEETTKTEERELETTDRLEMTRETEKTLQEDAALKAGLTISGKYGPTVDFSASAEGSISRSREEATKSAFTYSKEITQRSSSKITERVLERRSLRVTTEVEEKNQHTLNNTGGTGHIRGVYQWVEKVYEAQMFNYGLRMMYDFMIPEPGAFLFEALRRAYGTAIEVEKPMSFSLRPDQVTEYNYPFWVKEYGATDVDPPPEIYRTKALDYSAGGGDEKTDYNHSAQVTIDDGYRAISAWVGVTGNVWDDDASVDVVIGHRATRILNAGFKVWFTSLDNERDTVPFAVNTFRQSDVAIGVEIQCQRTDRAMVKWQHDTHAKLTQAYRARLAEYEEKLAALKAEAGIQIEGKNPAINLEIMKDELKKACTTILTEQHFDLFDSIENGTNGLPQMDLLENEAEGPYVRFFEQAFEWEHMTWVTYPYFWGRKSMWTERIAFEDPDPLFTQFIKAGYCRVVTPVRQGFEGAVDHFMTFGEIWSGGPLPPISNPLYLPIAEELAERLDRPGDEIPQGDPWEVRIPTNLVYLRQDGSLPAWTKDSNGDWHPV
jgi:hypothetical protein